MAFATVPLLLTACGVSKDAGKALGNAGSLAAAAIKDQARSTGRMVALLPEMHSVDQTLKCRREVGVALQACFSTAAKASPKLEQSWQQLQTVAIKRAEASAELAKAYKAFVALSEYNAGEQTKEALTSAFESLNQLSAAAGALTGTGLLVPVITSSFSTTAASIGGVIADWRQSRLMLAASKDLHTATNVLIAALTAEDNAAAWQSLMRALHAERAILVRTAVSSGLINPASALKPLFTEIAPDVALVTNPSAAELPVLRAAALASIGQRVVIERAEVTRGYRAAIAALTRLAEQHVKLENDSALDIASILASVDRLQSVLKTLPK